MILLTETYSVTLGQVVAALSPSILVAALFNPFLLVLFSVFCGVTAPYATLPNFWRFMYRVDPFTYLVGGLISTALHEQQVVCSGEEFQTFQPPSGQTCGQYAGAFANAVGAYINNESATSDCQYCQYAVGDTFLAGINVNYDQRWRNFGIYVSFFPGSFSFSSFSRSFWASLTCSYAIMCLTWGY